MVSFKSLFAYLFFTLAVMALFLYLLFPGQAVKAYMNARLSTVDPSLSLEAEKIRPSLPPGLTFTTVDVNRDSVRLVHINHARLSPALGTLFKDNKQLRFQSRIAGGRIDGRANVDTVNGLNLTQMEANLSGIHVEQIDAVKAFPKFTLSGILKGNLIQNKGRGPGNMINGQLSISTLRVGLTDPFFGIKELLVDQTDAELSLSGQTLRIKSMTFAGPMVEGKITGTVQLKIPFEMSRLNLTGNAKPQPDLFARLQETIPTGMANARVIGSRGIAFRIHGSIKHPDVSMR